MLLAFSPNDTAHAASCKSLRTQLAAVSQSGRSTPRNNIAAIKAQKRQLSSMRRTLRRNRCSGALAFFKRGDPAVCDGLKSTFKKMKRNLASLERSGGKVSAGSAKSERRRIQRQLDRKGCSQRRSAKASEKARRRSVMEQVFGTDAEKRRRRRAQREQEQLARLREDQGETSRFNGRFLNNYGKIRTICVRTCDGHNFPVSFSTRTSSLERDAEACQNLCPGTDMQLYLHRVRGEGIDDMVSAEFGEPYTELPNAYLHKVRYDATCTCNYRVSKRAFMTRPSSKLPPIGGTKLDPRNKRVVAPKLRAVVVDGGKSQQEQQLASNAQDAATVGEHPVLKTPPPKSRVRIIGETFLPNQ
ncbi:MAG: DUF2865 domain-containing protein [Pseudomonadota bacterium]